MKDVGLNVERVRTGIVIIFWVHYPLSTLAIILVSI